MKEQEVQFRKRLADLARTAYYREIPVFTDFLDLNELHMVHSFRPEEAGVMIRTFGGYEEAERQIAAFLPDALSYDMEDTETKDGSLPYGWEFPFVCICIRPLHEKYTDKLKVTGNPLRKEFSYLDVKHERDKLKIKENEKIRFNKLKKFIWISYGKYVIICLLIEKTKKKGEKYDYYDNTFY